MTETPTVVTTIDDLRRALDERRAEGRRIGLVPTMGALHDGHASLMRAASADTDCAVVSIFVNPLQFAANEDLSDYPRDFEGDCRLAAERGVQIVFAPSVDEMYPAGAALTRVSVPSLGTRWEGASRPTHFSGVATVVAKLLNIVGPCTAFFGEKDFQQLAIIRRMVADLSMPVTIIGCPIIREPDGLAMSSRNVYLGPDERAAAAVLRLALDAGEALIRGGSRNPALVRSTMEAVVEGEPLALLDYAAVVDPATLEEPHEIVDNVRLLIAARVGRPRLIDNCEVRI